MIHYEINPKYKHLKDDILSLPNRFEQEGEIIYKGRNILKVIEIKGIKMCIKSFKIPHLINQIAYVYFRKSKAERSFMYASRFTKMGIGTPEPIAYILYKNKSGLLNSYYICCQQEYNFTFRGIITLPQKEMEKALRQFTRFTYNFHQKGVYFIDHSPGNTLIRKTETGEFAFYLVDLNRTKFTKVSHKQGLKNLSNLEASEEMLQIMAEEYASLTHEDEVSMTKELICLTKKHNKATERKSFIRNTRRKIKHLFVP